MKMNEARAAVSAAFRCHLTALGFHEARSLVFVRGTDARLEILSFSLRRDKSGAYCYSVGVGVRFSAISQMKGATIAGQDFFSTVGVPLHLLDPIRRYREWCFTDSVSDVLEPLALITEYGLPFLAKYATLADVREALASTNPVDWFTLTPRQRDELLALIIEAEHAERQ